MHFQRNRYVLKRSPNASTKFGKDQSISKEMATVYGIQDGGDRHHEFLQLCISDDIHKLEINDAVFALNLMKIDQ